MRNYEFDIDTGEARFLPRAGEPVGLNSFEGAVEQAGFELLGSELEVLGTLGRVTDGGGQERPTLTVPSTAQQFVLFEGETQGDREGYAALFEWRGQPEQIVKVRGRPHGPPTESAALTVREFSVSQ